MPSADDPDEVEQSSYPINWGFNSSNKVKCKRKAKPGEKRYCLRPANDSEIWLRADDNYTRVPLVQHWRSPSPPGNMATGDPKRKWEHASYITNAFGDFPGVRLRQSTSLKLKWPQGFKKFTLFLVGRQVEGTETGPILRSGKRFHHALYWLNGNTIVIDSKHGLPAKFNYEGATDFHLLMLYFDGEDVTAFSNGKLIGTQPLKINRSFALTYVGSEPGKSSGKNPLKSMFKTGPDSGPLVHASDIAELIMYPEALSNEDIKKTLRYLRKKFGLI